ncbi:MAG: STAS domain-containing protein [Flavobacteriales bacterium]
MHFETEQNDRYALLRSHVEKLDSTKAPDLKSEIVYLNKQGYRNMIVDLSASKYCDSSGLSAILVGNRLCKENDGSFVLAGVQDGVQKLISISQLEGVINITPTVEEAKDLLFMEEVERDLGKEEDDDENDDSEADGSSS